ncbi:NAD(P)/FAD-dependent oxidoreductase [Actinoplanes sp. N902-109]|uniref:FAD-dependent oxidoreductase n=1 Tax=Actinoplanes sp. (strain N902-109) TaxID=649831 RepID=UPI0003294D71|nr:NAD(P)/FAD-dependent oxidoreductase [Actinoplanes sp. N902-109]AGL20858.1 putative monooxygenase [Actinoplanes sp. N902-109]
MTRVRTALVVGGGIAGPVAAAALHKAGIAATVVEAYPSGGRGGRIALAPNGLDALGVVGAREAVAAHATPLRRSILTFGRSGVELPVLPDLPPLHLVERSALHAALAANAAPVPLWYGKRLVHAHDTGEQVIATLADGSTLAADVLIGADGVRSAVRGIIDPHAPHPRFTGVLGFEGVAAHEVDAEPGTLTFAFGRRGYYLFWPMPGGGTVWGANLPWPRPLRITEARETPPEEWLRVLRDTYGEDDPGGALIRSTSAASLVVSGGLEIMPSVPHWYRGRMVLTGDAVHAPSNSSGQGASLAMESAVQLARCLRDLPLAEALPAYEKLRRPRVEKIARQAARINHRKAPGAAARLVLPVLMRMLLRTAMNAERTLGEQQRHRIAWDEPVSAGQSAFWSR